ncbi:MAG: nitroreductase [Acidobacteria bacterium RIFCSPHIGHO2_12_FULL_67_30]|nr:MAG: nitroreductase [Acidobacteria bacterium RIFCSPHIGHO2_01_FULL_67_28]OFV88163.1 MAG: nitroreductase [Acidobacteria bacterium RIFCSPHIGHO2_12_FULL_67_30]
MPARIGPEAEGKKTSSPEVIALPAPERKGRVTLEEALGRRRSVREFAPTSLTERELGQLLWAAQGITHPEGYRTAPSAGALYPLETYVVIASGFYHYDPRRHQLRRLSDKDLRRALYRAALEQESVLEAPAVFVLVAVYERTAGKYGPSRARRYVDLEAGHAAQNLLLQAVALDLGGVPLGAFEDAAVQRVLSLPADHRLLYLIPVGHPR